MPTAALPLRDFTLHLISDTPFTAPCAHCSFQRVGAQKNALEEQSSSHLAQQEVN